MQLRHSGMKIRPASSANASEAFHSRYASWTLTPHAMAMTGTRAFACEVSDESIDRLLNGPGTSVAQRRLPAGRGRTKLRSSPRTPACHTGAMETAVLASEERVLEGLSGRQRDAVLHGDGPLLIIAGAGTGKTTVLTRRIAHLISSKRARPEEVLALTFTEKAAVEMAERVDQLIPYGYAETRIGTFHAFGDRILRESALEVGLGPEFRVLTRPEQIIFLRERLWRLPLRRFRPLGDPTRHLGALLGLVSRAKDEDIAPAAYKAWAEARLVTAQDDAARDVAERHVELAGFYEAYQRLLGEAGAVDFGDQICRALALIRERPAVLAALRARYRYILVDELQDTNRAQLEMVRLLAAPDRPNVTVVGDDDQAKIGRAHV